MARSLRLALCFGCPLLSSAAGLGGAPMATIEGWATDPYV